MYELSSATLRELHESLLLSFSAHSPDVMSLYHQAPPVPTGDMASILLTLFAPLRGCMLKH